MINKERVIYARDYTLDILGRVWLYILIGVGKRVMKTKLIFIFAGIVGLGIVFTGYLFNVVL